MSKFELKMPKLGESVQEATITKWMVEVGDTVKEDDNLLEIATDKVDSEIPSPVDGKILEILFPQDALVPVGEVIAIIASDEEEQVTESNVKGNSQATKESNVEQTPNNQKEDISITDINNITGKFFSPLVKNIAKKESITANELTNLQGTGRDGRVTKQDVLVYLDTRASGGSVVSPVVSKPTTQTILITYRNPKSRV